MIFPIRPCFGALSKLALAVLAKRVHTDWWKRDRAGRVVGLGRDEVQALVMLTSPPGLAIG